IIYEINRRLLDEIERRWPGDAERKARMSLIQEQPVRMVRMAHLAIVGSHHVNGVAALHSELIKSRLVPDFAELSPTKFTNVTNGITPRRFLLACNEPLSKLIREKIGDEWVNDLGKLRGIEPLANDAKFQAAFQAAKTENKKRFASWVHRKMGINLPMDAIYDVQVKRLHEYKRQYLNILQVVHRYQRLLENPEIDLPPRVMIFSAKAAPAYHRAKLIIKLINDVAHVINRDERIKGKLKVVFVPNYSVSLAEIIIPAADLSEQISLAGTEASGTGNMKFALNGALTIGTLDGANIEIRDAVGADNFFHFGMTADEVQSSRGAYNPWNVYHANLGLRHALDAIGSGLFSQDFPSRFKDLFDAVTHHRDHYMLLADFDSYVAAQARVDALWQDRAAWTRAAILNVARIGHFSSDRAVREYAENIWHVKPAEFDGSKPLRPSQTKPRTKSNPKPGK
ncbi:MAG: glycogen/starch/alpha-glucan family phosphorylase, partial [Phycisphaerae bacterium]